MILSRYRITRLGNYLFILLFSGFLLPFCGQRSREDSARSGPAQRDKSQGGTLVVGVRADPESLNPLTALSQTSRNVIGLIFRRLADIEADLNSFSPRLAKGWTFSADSLAITFHLRTDVRWHDGVPFTAADVAFTFRLHKNPAVGWDGLSYKTDILGVTSDNDSTVTFHFRRRSLTMLMDAVEGYIIPKHLLQNIPAREIHHCDFNRHPIGTGPFTFEQWNDQQAIYLRRFDSYYKEARPYLDRVIFKVIPENFSLISQLRAGEIDLVEHISPADFQKLQAEWQAGHVPIRPYSYLGRQYDFIGWNLIDPGYYQRSLEKNKPQNTSLDHFIKPHPLFGNPKVRRALTMAIDRQALIQHVNHGLAVPMHGPVPPILKAYNEKANHAWPYRPAQARRLLLEAGWRDSDKDGYLDREGHPFDFELVTVSGNTRYEQVATIIQDQLRQIGVKMTPRPLEPALLFGQLLPAKDFDAALISWSVGLKMDLAPLFHSSSFFTPFHFTGYYSPHFDSLDAASKATLNRNTAQHYHDAIAQLLSRDLPYTWLYYRLNYSAIHSRFHDVTVDRRGIFNNVEEWWIPLSDRTASDKIFQD